MEIGARGLVASRTYRTFTAIGFTNAQAKKLCKLLSTVSARCSYAIYLAHKDHAWHRSELISVSSNIVEADGHLPAKVKAALALPLRKRTSLC